jgi:hypothetical protein
VSMMGAGLRPQGKPWDQPPYPKVQGAPHFYPDQRLSLSTLREGPRKICQGFKPDSGKLTVRDYRGASGNVRHGGNVIPPRNRKSGSGNPLTYSVARPISIPVKRCSSSETLHRNPEGSTPSR